MADAWQAREYEQQKFIEGLARKVREWARENGGSVDTITFLNAIGVTYYHCIINGFVGRLLDELIMPGLASHKDSESPVSIFLKKEIVSDIDSFIRVPSERCYLLYLLLEQLLLDIRSLVSQRYIEDQVRNPKKVFGTPSATTKVEMP